MIRIVGRSSSHYTRVTRMFALELGVEHRFEPILQLGSVDASTYAGNPALKMPSLVDDEGPLFGTENICRRLARGRRDVVLRGDVEVRVVANAEELTLHGMAADVDVILAKLAGQPASPKVVRGLENSLAWLDEHLAAVRAALPAGRAPSFVEVALYCLVEHLPFREVVDVAPYSRLATFCQEFGARASAVETAYRFDAKA
ncbi:MAG: glutathione S-transferase family protein [Labilithrix sp.]|nr:glutathione S-transferase family protein [Labilithrix sp.]MCW5814989.1 glutathione S-transferase family protein [Labilithrix sp.]